MIGWQRSEPWLVAQLLFLACCVRATSGEHSFKKGSLEGLLYLSCGTYPVFGLLFLAHCLVFDSLLRFSASPRCLVF